MFFNAIFSLITVLFTLLFSPFPVITELPWGIDPYMVQGVGYVRILADFFPPLATLFTAFGIYISFRLGMIVIKLFLGSRTPIHN